MSSPKTVTKPITLIQTAQPQYQPPPMYHVILLNDDYTPMEFVVEVLKLFFYKDELAAIQLMLQIHTQGSAICGTYPHEIAETKQEQVVQYAKSHQHPLICTIEAE